MLTFIASTDPDLGMHSWTEPSMGHLSCRRDDHPSSSASYIWHTCHSPRRFVYNLSFRSHKRERCGCCCPTLFGWCFFEVHFVFFNFIICRLFAHGIWLW